MGSGEITVLKNRGYSACIVLTERNYVVWNVVIIMFFFEICVYYMQFIHASLFMVNFYSSKK